MVHNRVMKLKTKIFQSGNTTGIVVPEEKVEELNSGKRPKVVVTVGKHTYRSSIAHMGGRYLISLSAANREKAGVQGGDEVVVEIVLDTAPREVEVPEDLATALAGEPAAKKFFESLSYSKQLAHVLSVEGAKKAETRQRRVEKVLETLLAGKS